MFPRNAAAAKRLGKRKVKEVAGESAEPFAAAAHCFNPHGHYFASTSVPVDGRRSQVHKILNNAAATVPFSYMALLTADDDGHDEDDSDDYECCPISKDINNQRGQINQLIMFHNENLRQSVVEMIEKHHHSVHRAEEKQAAKRLKVNEAKLQEKLAQNEELERLNELYKGEAERLLTRVRYLERAAMSLSESLQQANAARRCAEREEEEAESSFQDPDRVEPVRLDCKVCQRQLATVMVWPCRHVCVCTRCNAATKCCPVCRIVKTTSVEVCLPLD